MQHPNHPDHDLALIAAHAAGDLTDAERTRAQSLIDTCGACADVHRDLIAIAAATRSLPALATSPRDFRLSREQAAQLTRGSWLRKVLAPFGATRSATRPIAAAFTSLGIAGLLVATFLPGMFGSAASSQAGAERDLSNAGAAAGPTAAPAPPVAPVATAASAPGGGVYQPASNPTSGSDSNYGKGTTPTGVSTGTPMSASSAPPTTSHAPTSVPEFAVGGDSASEAPRAAADTSGRLTTTQAPPNFLLLGSLALLAAGLLLFGLRFASRRLR